MTKKDKNNYYIDSSSFIEVTTELADYIMQEKLGKNYDNYIYEEQGSISFTAKGQEIFNRYLEEIEGFFSNVNILHEDQKENEDE